MDIYEGTVKEASPPPDAPNGRAEPIRARKIYEQCLYPKLQPHQRVMQVPYIAANNPLVCAHYNRSCPLAPQAEQNVLRLRGYFEWARNDSRVGGMVPWHFENRTSTRVDMSAANQTACALANSEGLHATPAFSCSWDFVSSSCNCTTDIEQWGTSATQAGDMSLGAEAMPTVVSELQKIGRYILNASSTRIPTTDTTAHDYAALAKLIKRVLGWSRWQAGSSVLSRSGEVL